MKVFGILLVLVFAGCSEPSAPKPKYSGKWDLVSVNGLPVPAIYNLGSNGTTVRVESGQVWFLYEDKASWRDSVVMTFTDGTKVNLSKFGVASWSEYDGKLTLARTSSFDRLPSFADFVLQPDGTLLYASDGNPTEVYRKE